MTTVTELRGILLANKSVETANKVLIDIDLSDQVLEGVDFSHYTLEKIKFTKCVLKNCRFRKAQLKWCDFRYTIIEKGTFEGAIIEFCDFYRAFFDGVIIFNNSKISNSSLNKTHIGESAIIRRNNLVNDQIIQQNKMKYCEFLTEWPGVRTNDAGIPWMDPIHNLGMVLANRWQEAEDTYKRLNALWCASGFIADANWAYVQGRRMERKRMIMQLIQQNKLSCKEKLKNIWKIITNFISDILFGYGESMIKMIITYVITIFIFAWIFYSNTSIIEYTQALGISLKNMVGMDDEILHDVSPFVDMLNIIQTTIGIILTGIFGFILGNKIRNQ